MRNKALPGMMKYSPLKQGNIHTDVTGDGVVPNLKQGSGYASKQKRKNYFITSKKKNRSVKQVFTDYGKQLKNIIKGD